ncbi:MAG: TOBE domain-containing protein, partial [Moorea sp. SIO3G5]|nr:TOBE domain-containing protein [Moorena sp. SIO3G5]
TLNCQGNYALLGQVKISLPNLPQVPPQIALGIRPEDVALAQPQDRHRIEGRIYLVENLGMHNLISVRVKGSDSLSIRALLPNNLTWETEEVTLAIPPQSIHWFDSETCVRVASL